MTAEYQQDPPPVSYSSSNFLSVSLYFSFEKKESRQRGNKTAPGRLLVSIEKKNGASSTCSNRWISHAPTPRRSFIMISGYRMRKEAIGVCMCAYAVVYQLIWIQSGRIVVSILSLSHIFWEAGSFWSCVHDDLYDCFAHFSCKFEMEIFTELYREKKNSSL